MLGAVAPVWFGCNCMRDFQQWKESCTVKTGAAANAVQGAVPDFHRFQGSAVDFDHAVREICKLCYMTPVNCV